MKKKDKNIKISQKFKMNIYVHFQCSKFLSSLLKIHFVIHKKTKKNNYKNFNTINYVIGKFCDLSACSNQIRYPFIHIRISAILIYLSLDIATVTATVGSSLLAITTAVSVAATLLGAAVVATPLSVSTAVTLE